MASQCSESPGITDDETSEKDMSEATIRNHSLTLLILRLPLVL